MRTYGSLRTRYPISPGRPTAEALNMSRRYHQKLKRNKRGSRPAGGIWNSARGGHVDAALWVPQATRDRDVHLSGNRFDYGLIGVRRKVGIHRGACKCIKFEGGLLLRWNCRFGSLLTKGKFYIYKIRSEMWLFSLEGTTYSLILAWGYVWLPENFVA